MLGTAVPPAPFESDQGLHGLTLAFVNSDCNWDSCFLRRCSFGHASDFASEMVPCRSSWTAQGVDGGR